MKSIIQQVNELSTPIGDDRGFSIKLEDFVERVIGAWMEDDIFFRGFDREFAPMLHDPRVGDANLVVFKKEGMNCFFGYPECRTQLMLRLGLNGNAHRYTTEIQAAIMIFLARYGFEYVGTFTVKDIVDYDALNHGRPDTRNLSVHKSMLGRVIKDIDHVGFRLRERQWGRDMYLLVPKGNLVREVN